MSNGISRPKVQISASGVSAYTFTRQIDGWTWMSSDQPEQQPYNGEDLQIINNGAVTVIDGTKSFEFASLSRALDSDSTKFTVSGSNDDIFHVTLAVTPATSTVYYIQNVNSKLYLQATGENGAERGVTQQDFSPSTPGFQWRLIDLGNNVFRVYSVGTGYLLYAESAQSQQSLRVGSNPSSGAVVNWIRDGEFFRAASETNLVWDVKNASRSAGSYVQIYTKKSSNAGNQEFTLSTEQPS